MVAVALSRFQSRSSGSSAVVVGPGGWVRCGVPGPGWFVRRLVARVRTVRFLARLGSRWLTAAPGRSRGRGRWGVYQKCRAVIVSLDHPLVRAHDAAMVPVIRAFCSGVISRHTRIPV